MKTQIPQNQRKENFQKNASLVQMASEYCKFRAKHFKDKATIEYVCRFKPFNADLFDENPYDMPNSQVPWLISYGLALKYP